MGEDQQNFRINGTQINSVVVMSSRRNRTKETALPIIEAWNKSAGALPEASDREKYTIAPEPIYSDILLERFGPAALDAFRKLVAEQLDRKDTLTVIVTHRVLIDPVFKTEILENDTYGVIYEIGLGDTPQELKIVRQIDLAD